MITKNKKKCKRTNNNNIEGIRISGIEKTEDVLTDRAGLLLFVKYLSQIGIYPLIERYFGSMRKSKKGIPIENIFKQLFCFFVDGTSFSLLRFDEIKRDKGYIETIENNRELMLSSHSAKRFFYSFSFVRIWLFRRLLQDLFIWRLTVEKPDIIILGMDTTVLDNNDAKKREGVQGTYQKTRGFQPLQMNYGNCVIDAVFRGGKKHSNYGNTVIEAVSHIVKRIRKEYGEDVPIIIRADAGFFDKKNFEAFERMNIGYICGGRVYSDIKEKMSKVSSFEEYEKCDENGNCVVWEYKEFTDKRGNWNKERRAIYTRIPYNGKRQLVLDFAKEERIIYTNLGTSEELNKLFIDKGKEEYLNPDKIIETYHNRGNDELVNRYLKEFGTEKLPFKRFIPNAAFYYIMCVSFFLCEAFKKDVLLANERKEGTEPANISPTTVRRTFIDFAGRIVHTGRRIILKVTEWIWERINIPLLWHRCNNPVPI